jgi:transposase InsO family protein
VHQIRRRIAAEGLESALLPSSRAPISSPQSVDPVIAELACAIRLELIADGWDAGPISVQSRMRDRGIQPPSRATLARIFTRAGLVTPQPRKRPRSSWHRFVHPFPNSCWQLDAFIVRLADRSSAVGFQLTDDHSRLAVASLAAAGETSNAAVQVVRTGIERHGIPQRLLTDNGSAFNLSRRGMTTPLTAYLAVLGVQAITGRPSHPTTQGKNERHHATTRRWLAAHPTPATIDDLQQLLDDFNHAYNTQRPHQALNGRTPASAYAALPKAAPPAPPVAQQVPEQQHITVRTVDSRGVIYAARRQFKVSRTLIGKTVIVLHDDHVFHLIDNHGTIIDTHTDPPLDRYIPRTTPSDQQET